MEYFYSIENAVFASVHSSLTINKQLPNTIVRTKSKDNFNIYIIYIAVYEALVLLWFNRHMLILFIK